MSYRFVKEHDPKNEYDNTNVTIEVIDGEITVTELVRVFEEFMKACGFSLKGNIAVVEEEDAA